MSKDTMKISSMYFKFTKTENKNPVSILFERKANWRLEFKISFCRSNVVLLRSFYSFLALFFPFLFCFLFCFFCLRFAFFCFRSSFLSLRFCCFSSFLAFFCAFFCCFFAFFSSSFLFFRFCFFCLRPRIFALRFMQHSLNFVWNPMHMESPLTILFRSVVAMASVRLHVLFLLAAISPIRQHFVSSAFGLTTNKRKKRFGLMEDILLNSPYIHNDVKQTPAMLDTHFKGILQKFLILIAK